MAKLFRTDFKLKEGEFFNKWSHNRFKKNKNVLGTITGPTGSSKSYTTLSALNIYYLWRFKKQFPIENCCFSLGQAAKRLDSGGLMKGEFLMLEEAGANLGSLDFQSRLQKLFTYILQSFRSMNVGLILTLPVLTMLNKQARQLIHFNFTTSGINYETNTSKVKPYFHQLNQKTGKSYWKFPRTRVKGSKKKIQAFNYPIPPKELIDAYEIKKTKFVSDITKEFVEEYEEKERKKVMGDSRKEMTDAQKEVYDLACQGLNQREIGERLGKMQQSIQKMLKTIKKHGYTIKINENVKENEENRGVV